jgi:hypothetical protein
MPVPRISHATQIKALLAAPLLLLVMQGCSTPAVGAPCLPEQIPDNGFDPREAYIESSSVQCETRVCMVFRLDGDPQKGCTPTMMKKCPTEDEVERSVYCTCRCDSGTTGFAECECPDGFSCVEVLNKGGPGVRGGYCVRNDSVSKS